MLRIFNQFLSESWAKSKDREVRVATAVVASLQDIQVPPTLPRLPWPRRTTVMCSLRIQGGPPPPWRPALRRWSRPRRFEPSLPGHHQTYKIEGRRRPYVLASVLYSECESPSARVAIPSGRGMRGTADPRRSKVVPSWTSASRKITKPTTNPGLGL